MTASLESPTPHDNWDFYSTSNERLLSPIFARFHVSDGLTARCTGLNVACFGLCTGDIQGQAGRLLCKDSVCWLPQQILYCSAAMWDNAPVNVRPGGRGEGLDRPPSSEGRELDMR